MQHRREDQDDVVRLQTVFPGEPCALDRLDGKSRRRRPEAKRLHQDLFDIAHLPEVLDARHLVAEHRVHGRAGLQEHSRILEEEIGGKGEEAAGRLVSGDEECDHLKDDILFAQLLAGDRVDTVQHQIEEIVLFGAARVLLPLGDQLARHGHHHRLVGRVFAASR